MKVTLRFFILFFGATISVTVHCAERAGSPSVQRFCTQVLQVIPGFAETTAFEVQEMLVPLKAKIDQLSYQLHLHPEDTKTQSELTRYQIELQNLQRLERDFNAFWEQTKHQTLALAQQDRVSAGGR